MTTKAKKPKTVLNMGAREEIVAALIAHRFDAVKKELKERPHTLADEFYRQEISEAEQAQMEATPKNWFVRYKTNVQLWVDGRSFYHSLTEARPIPYQWRNSSLRSSSPLGKKIMAFWKEKEKLDVDIANTRATTMATLKGFKYIEDLVEAWPEIKKFIPADLKAKQKQVTALAIPVKDLNHMLRLP